VEGAEAFAEHLLHPLEVVSLALGRYGVGPSHVPSPRSGEMLNPEPLSIEGERIRAEAGGSPIGRLRLDAPR
jgi:hypothetical protein